MRSPAVTRRSTCCSTKTMAPTRFATSRTPSGRWSGTTRACEMMESIIARWQIQKWNVAFRKGYVVFDDRLLNAEVIRRLTRCPDQVVLGGRHRHLPDPRRHLH